MHTPGHRAPFNRGERGASWPSLAVSVGMTAAMFVCAFESMRSREQWDDSADAATSATTLIVPLPLPQPLRNAPRTRPPATRSTSRATIPNVAIPPAQSPIASHASQAVPTPVSPDSTGTRTTPTPAQDHGATVPDPVLNPRGGVTAAPVGLTAPIAAAGVTLYNLSPETRSARDSLLPGTTVGAFGASRFLYSPATPAEREAISLGQRQAAMVQHRSTSAGNTRDLIIPHGNAAGGAGSIGESVGLSLFSSGPSAAQRRKNEALDSEYNARLTRLQARIRMKRDSIRADSLRRDSLARRGGVP